MPCHTHMSRNSCAMSTMQFASRTPCVVPWNWVVWRAAGGTAAISEPCLPSCLMRKSYSLARFHAFGKRPGSRYLTWHALEPHIGHQFGSQAPVSTRSALGPQSQHSHSTRSQHSHSTVTAHSHSTVTAQSQHTVTAHSHSTVTAHSHSTITAHSHSSSTASGFPEMRARCQNKNDVEALTSPGWRATGLSSSSTSLQRVGR